MRGLSGLALGVIVVLLLRSTALTAFAARGLVIDVLAFAVTIWALRHGPSWGATFGFALGLCADVDTGHWLGRHALALSLLGYFVGRLSDTLVRESVRTQLVLLALTVFFHQAAVVSFELSGTGGWPYLMTRSLLAALVTAPIGTALLWIGRRIAGQPLFGNARVQPGKTI
jgi:rod shape-determining protein MreD